MDIRFKNGQLNGLIQVLTALELNTKETRMRTRFKKMIGKYLQETIAPERTDIIKKYATKNEDGSLVYSDVEKKTVMFEDAWEEEEALKHLEELDSEEYIVILDSYNEMMITSVANSLINSEDIKINGELADWFDDWCVEFEKALEHYNKPKEKENKE